MSVGRHTMYNIAGSLAPMFITVLTVPAYLHLVGSTRYGVLALVWMFLGYFGMFDPGIGRAAAYHIAKLHDGPARQREDVFWTAMLINLLFGLAGGLVLYMVARPLFVSTFKMPDAMRAEVVASLPWLAASLPVSVMGNILSGVLQAREWFGVSNTLNVVNSILSQLVPLGVAYFHGPELTWLIPAILLTRALGFVPTILAVASAMPLGVGGSFRPPLVKTLFAYGGWITVTNLINPVLTSMDRMLIGGVLGTDAVAFYSVAYNLATKATILPGALVGSLFPKLSRGSAVDTARLANEAVIELAAIMTPLVVAGLLGMPIFMKLWVGSPFALHAAPVATILLMGLWINGLAWIPNTLLQARNRPGLVAIFHSIEIIPFLAILWLGLHFFGLLGAAWATTLRVTVDAILLFAVGMGLRGWVRILPGALFVVIAPLVAPSILISQTSLWGVCLLLVATIWGSLMSSKIRNMVYPKLLSLSGAKSAL